MTTQTSEVIAVPIAADGSAGPAGFWANSGARPPTASTATATPLMEVAESFARSFCTSLA